MSLVVLIEGQILRWEVQITNHPGKELYRKIAPHYRIGKEVKDPGLPTAPWRTKVSESSRKMTPKDLPSNRQAFPPLSARFDLCI